MSLYQAEYCSHADAVLYGPSASPTFACLAHVFDAPEPPTCFWDEADYGQLVFYGGGAVDPIYCLVGRGVELVHCFNPHDVSSAFRNWRGAPSASVLVM